MNNRKYITKRIFFILGIIVIVLFVFCHRYTYYSLPIVSNPDSVVAFATNDINLEQTWQPTVKQIAGVSIPYEANDNVIATMHLNVYNDDYSELLIEKSEKIEIYAGDVGTIEYFFDRIKVIPGERYHIKLAFADVITPGALSIKCGSNYGGCSIAEESENLAAAFEITCVKNSKIFWLFAVLFPMSSISLFLMITFDKKWEETIGCSLLFEGIILYICGIFGHLVSGINLIFILSILLAIYECINVNRKQIKLRQLLSPGIWIYFILFFIIIITCQENRFAGSDQLVLWGMVPRDMFYYDGLYNHMNSGIMLHHMHYPPFAGIIEYLYIYLNGVFSEEVVFIAFQSLLVSVMMVLFIPINSNKKNIFPAMITAICLPIVFFIDISSETLVEPLIGALFVYILVSYFEYDMDMFSCIRILIGLIALTLVKETGFVLAVLLVFVIFVDYFVKRFMQVPSTKKQVLFSIISMIIVITFFASWNIYASMPMEKVLSDKNSGTISAEHELETSQSIDENNDDFVPQLQAKSNNSSVSKSGISIDKLIGLMQGKAEDYQYDVIDSFIIFLFENQFFLFGVIKISYFGMMVIICSLCWIATHFKSEQENGDKFVRFAIMLLVISAGYCLCHLLLYIFTFSEQEAVRVAALGRYLSPCVYGFFAIFLYLLYDNTSVSAENQKDLGPKYIAIAICIVFMTNIPISQLIIEQYEREDFANEEITYGYSDIAEILRSVGKRGERVYFICEDGTSFMEYIFRNEIFPMLSSQGNSNIVSTQEAVGIMASYYDRDEDSSHRATVITMEEWSNTLKDYDYLVIFHSDKMFIESYGKLFEEIETIGDGTIYHIQKNEDGILLEFIGKTGIKKYK